MNSQFPRNSQLLRRLLKLQSLQYQQLLRDLSKEQSSLRQYERLIATLNHIIDNSSSSLTETPLLSAIQLKNHSQYKRQLTFNLCNCAIASDQKRKDITRLAREAQKKNIS